MNPAMNKALLTRLMLDIDALLYWAPLIVILLIIFFLLTLRWKYK
jgi:hypothetical protein